MFRRSEKMFEVDRTPIKVTKEDFEIYVSELIKGSFSPFVDDFRKA